MPVNYSYLNKYTLEELFKLRDHVNLLISNKLDIIEQPMKSPFDYKNDPEYRIMNDPYSFE